MKKIMLVIHSLGKGGAERVMSNLANYFCDKYLVEIVLLNEKVIDYDIDDKINITDLHNNWFKNKEKHNIAERIYNFIKIVKKLRKRINEYKPDVILSFMPKNSYKTLLANNKNYKVFVGGRNDPNKQFENKISYYLMKKLYKKAFGIICQTTDEKIYYEKLFDNKLIKIIPNSVNKKFVREKIYEGNVEKCIVSVGRLVEQKNFEMLINAFSKVKYKDFKLIIYGEGEKRQELERLIKDKKLENKVLLPGVVDNIEELLQNKYMFVSTSIFEGMPNALLEAMCLGIPSIATNCPCGGPKDMIENMKNGILIEVNDEKALVEKIELIISNEELRKELARNSVLSTKKYNPDIINKIWEKTLINGCGTGEK